MKRSINLYYYRLQGKKQNFGDILSPFIIEKISGRKTSYIASLNKKMLVLPYYFYGLIRGNKSVLELKSILKSILAKEVLVAIGSVLAKVKRKSCKIWGTGLHTEDFVPAKAKYFAVRGPLTQEYLKSQGISPPDVTGDPAILIPLIIPSSNVKKYRIGIIPHYIHMSRINIDDALDEIKLINLLDPIEKVLDDITSCDYILSTSLHGIIVSQAYGIPALWSEFSDVSLAGGKFKFHDYFLSVGIDIYEPYEMINKIGVVEAQKISKLFITLEAYSLPKVSIEKKQKELLNVFPYKLTEEFAAIKRNLL